MALSRRSMCCPAAVLAGLLFVSGSVVRAEHANIDLQLIGPENEVRAGSDQAPPPGGVKKPPVMTVRAGDPLVLQFFLTNVYPHGRLKHVKVRYYVVRVQEHGKQPTPSLKKGVITRGAMTMNFKPKCRVGARLQFRVPEPGLYTVRVDTRNTKSDHEHFSAIDLKVE